MRLSSCNTDKFQFVWQAWKRGMLLGVRFVKTVPLRYKFKPTSPRDADTAKSLFLVVCSVPAVCEPFGFVPSDCDIKINTIHEGWCSFLWRRKRDSILAAARSRSRENNTQLFSNALAPLRYPWLLA